MTTIRDVAERLGVSIATVSRVLNGYPDVAPETRERVLAAVREQDYRPVRAARSLVTGRSHVIGVILETGAGHPDLQHPFFQEVLVGLKHTLGAHGFDLLLFSVEENGNGSAPSDEQPDERPGGQPAERPTERLAGRRRYLARARQHGVDGIVLLGVDPHDPDVEEITGSEIPTMAVDLDLVGARTGFVMSDNVAGAALAVRHLAELGHERIALIAGPSSTRPGVDRLLGFRRELERLGLPHRPEYIREGDYYPESGYDTTVGLLALPEPPTAVFAAADLMAAGALRAVADRGLECPADIAVVGFDDIQIAALLHPALTTIRQDKLGLGAAAADALVASIEGDEPLPPSVVVPVELVARASTIGRVLDSPDLLRQKGGANHLS